MFPEYHFRGETLSLFGVAQILAVGPVHLVLLNLRHILQSIHNKCGKGIMLPVKGPAAVDTRESCRQVHQVKGSVSGDVINNSLI